MTHPLHLNERTDWQTPPEFLDRVRRVGPIVLDPCTTWRNPTGAALFYAPISVTPEGAHGPGAGGAWLGPDGLAAALPTVGLSFWNPPYGRHLSGPIDPTAPIMHKGALVGRGTGWALKWATHEGERIALVPNRTETEWWGAMADACRLFCFPNARIPFVDPDTGLVGKQPNHGSTVFYGGPRPGHFRDAFREVGRIYEGGTP